MHVTYLALQYTNRRENHDFHIRNTSKNIQDSTLRQKRVIRHSETKEKFTIIFTSSTIFPLSA